jgi:fermentation-respiration switch protein FrsA (DUF1100 family)
MRMKGDSWGRLARLLALTYVSVAAYAYITGPLHVRPDRLIVFGHSLGGGPSAELLMHHPAAGLVLESTFTSAFRVLTHAPLLPFDHLATIDKLSRIHVPLMVIHGRQDDTIPFAHGEALYAAAPEPKRCLWLDAAGHDDVVEVGGETYVRALKAFAASLK